MMNRNPHVSHTELPLTLGRKLSVVRCLPGTLAGRRWLTIGTVLASSDSSLPSHWHCRLQATLSMQSLNHSKPKEFKSPCFCIFSLSLKKLIYQNHISIRIHYYPILKQSHTINCLKFQLRCQNLADARRHVSYSFPTILYPLSISPDPISPSQEN